MPIPRLARISLVIWLLGCSKPGEAAQEAVGQAPQSVAAPSAATVHYAARGVVHTVDDEKSMLWIAHEDIPGYMKAMTMPFMAAPAFRRLVRAGDRVEFSFHDDGAGHLVLDTLTKNAP